MPLAEAASLSRREDNLAAHLHDPTADLASLASIAEKCERFSPKVGWETMCSFDAGRDPFNAWWSDPGPSHLLLDITGISRSFDGEEKLLEVVTQDLARQGYQTSSAIADTIGAAWALAIAPGTEGLAIGASRSALSPLPVSSLRLPVETVDLLLRLGITRIEELLRLPRESLAARFGQQLLLRIDQAFGMAQEMIVPHRPPPSFQAEWILDYPTDSLELIDQILAQLLGRVTQALALRQEGILRLVCRFDGEGGQPLQLTVGLFRPSATARHLQDLVRMQLSQIKLTRQIGRVGIQAVLTAKLENRQEELFSGSLREHTREFALLVDRLSSRLGPQGVLHPVLKSERLPERAVCYRAMVAKTRSASGKKSKNRNSVPGPIDDSQSSLIRPLILRHPPQALWAISIVPDGPPVSFEYQGQVHRVVRQWGPERIETGWWRGSSIRRDYYRVETTAGLRYWLFRRIEDGQWHLQGEF